MRPCLLKNHGKSALIKFKDDSDSQVAIHLNGLLLGDLSLNIKPLTNYPSTEQIDVIMTHPSIDANLLIDDLEKVKQLCQFVQFISQDQTTEKQIQQICKDYGEIEEIYVTQSSKDLDKIAAIAKFENYLSAINLVQLKQIDIKSNVSLQLKFSDLSVQEIREKDLALIRKRAELSMRRPSESDRYQNLRSRSRSPGYDNRYQRQRRSYDRQEVEGERYMDNQQSQSNAKRLKKEEAQDKMQNNRGDAYETIPEDLKKSGSQSRIYRMIADDYD